MNKGQNLEAKLKHFLKQLKLNEDTISNVMGGIVVLFAIGLIINYFRSTNLKTWQGLLTNDKEASQTSAENNMTSENSERKYTVVKGDTLWKIAEMQYKSGYNYVDIMKANNIKPSGNIEVGMELVIPNVEPKKLTVIETSTEENDSNSFEVKAGQVIDTKKIDSSIEPGEYTIVKGDTYWSIAVRAYGDGYAWTKIYEANKSIFPNANRIEKDVKITVPALKQ